MKAYPTVITITHVFRITFKSTALVLLFIANSFFGYSQELSFRNSKLEPNSPATAGKDGAVYWFPMVTTDVDALVTINKPVEGSLPVKLSSFNASKKNGTKVSLNWTTEQEINASHFVVERSFDGREYDEAGLVFAIGNSHDNIDYRFTDDLRNKQSSIIYYRLRIVDMDGKTGKSAVRIIRNPDSKEEYVKILTYPNPVVSELRVQVPVSWQNNAVNIEILNNSGQVVKRQIANRAGQTEVVNVNDLESGIYFVRAGNGTGSSTQRIAKLK